MPIKNYLKLKPELTACHDGEGQVKIVNVYEKELTSPLNFVHYTVLPPLTSIGAHTHGDDEELYIVLAGEGVMTVDGTESAVNEGDVILNPPFGSHALRNTSDSEELKILVMEAVKGR